MIKVRVCITGGALLAALPILVMDTTLKGQESVQIQVVSQEVQAFAIKNKIYESLGTPDKVALYINTLIVIEEIAKQRARTLGRAVSDEDRSAAAWAICVVPWGPPKPEADVATFKRVRAKLVDDALISAERRTQIVRRVDFTLLAQSLADLKGKNVTPLQVVNVGGL
jgi:hypothetical protein